MANQSRHVTSQKNQDRCDVVKGSKVAGLMRAREEKSQRR